ncbi:hypothetical protein [Desulfoluna limicola]|nr:hypothetical protein [Desulfoluna limicola]
MKKLWICSVLFLALLILGTGQAVPADQEKMKDSPWLTVNPHQLFSLLSKRGCAPKAKQKQKQKAKHKDRPCTMTEGTPDCALLAKSGCAPKAKQKQKQKDKHKDGPCSMAETSPYIPFCA